MLRLSAKGGDLLSVAVLREISQNFHGVARRFSLGDRRIFNGVGHPQPPLVVEGDVDRLMDLRLGRTVLQTRALKPLSPSSAGSRGPVETTSSAGATTLVRTRNPAANPRPSEQAATIFPMKVSPDNATGDDNDAPYLPSRRGGVQCVKAAAWGMRNRWGWLTGTLHAEARAREGCKARKRCAAPHRESRCTSSRDRPGSSEHHENPGGAAADAPSWKSASFGAAWPGVDI